MAISFSPAAVKSLFEINESATMKAERPLSTVAFDTLYVMISLLLTVGIMMDVWSHVEFGPDQSLFNEYHLLFYGAMAAIMALLVGLGFANMRNGYPMAIALPRGYGLGLMATIIFAIAGGIDLVGHALFGFESDLEALTSPTHLVLFAGWFLIMFAPVKAARARQTALGQTESLLKSVPRLVSYGCMMFSVYVPLMLLYPMGGNPYMIQDYRPADTFHGLVMGIGGTLLQTTVMAGFVLWLVREFKMPFGSFTVTLGFYGLFITVLETWQMPWLMFGGLGLLLDLAYALIQPDGSRRGRYMLFALLMPLFMWGMFYGTMTYVLGGTGDFYYSGYNLFGSIAQAVVMSLFVGYLTSMSAPRSVAADAAIA